MTTPRLSALINDAFLRSKMPDPEKWNLTPGRRFPTHESYYEMLVDKTIVALIFDQNVHSKDVSKSLEDGQANIAKVGGDAVGKVVACAAAVPWKGGWAKEGAGKEEGWEIKAVAVDGDAQYLHKGLAVQVMGALENALIDQAKRQPSKMILEETQKPDCLTLWVLAAECINGAYWRKRGYREIRRSTEGNGTWGCKTSFDIVVFRKDVEYNALH
jgi:hypothetical protein